MQKELQIDGHLIGEGHPTFIIAEMSANHNMDYNRAVEILHAAAKAGADAVKIQTYTADTITIDSDKPWFRITQGTLWDGVTLHQLYETAYTPWEWHADLQAEAKKLGLSFFSSPFDLSSVDYLENLDVPCYKIASFELNDIPMLRKIAKLQKPIIMATGVAHKEDIELALQTCKEEGNEQVVLLKCTSAYPAPYHAVNLKMVPHMAEEFDCITGLSDHTMGSSVAIGAVAMGAHVIEKHLTLRRADGGADSAFSMEPEEFREMCEGIRHVEEAIGCVTYELSEKAAAEREHSRSLFAVTDIKAGELFTPENCRSIRPGYGLHTKYYEEILGKKAACDIEKGTPMSWKLVEGAQGRIDETPAVRK
ncbi:MAG: pseudaminic acid synthase [Lachnospiraceae bacterium]|nr:pseudaminic acid synthase [Lachnospiraceae bacterium]